MESRTRFLSRRKCPGWRWHPAGGGKVWGSTLALACLPARDGAFNNRVKLSEAQAAPTQLSQACFQWQWWLHCSASSAAWWEPPWKARWAEGSPRRAGRPSAGHQPESRCQKAAQGRTAWRLLGPPLELLHWWRRPWRPPGRSHGPGRPAYFPPCCCRGLVSCLRTPLTLDVIAAAPIVPEG